MGSLYTDYETLRPDIYLSEEQKAAMRQQLIPPKVYTVWSQMDIASLIVALRTVASQYKYGMFGERNPDSAVRNIHAVDCDQLSDMLRAIADNLYNRFAPKDPLDPSATPPPPQNH